MEDIPISSTEQHFDENEPEISARRLAADLFTGWRQGDELKVSRLNEGTTNLLFKVEHHNGTTSDPDFMGTKEVVLVKVYGAGTETTIDRNKELRFHKILADHKLATPPLVRFHGGHAYTFLPGSVCSLQDIRDERIWRAVAREIAIWHTTLPVFKSNPRQDANILVTSSCLPKVLLDCQPNIWVTAEKWLHAIPDESALKANLWRRFEYLINQLVGNELSENEAASMIFGHGDLLHGNIIVDTGSAEENALSDDTTVKFIDYEHCTYCPAPFELANHFSEWAGFECDYDLLPTRSVRKDFILEYMRTQKKFLKGDLPSDQTQENEGAAVTKLADEIDNYRGFPGFYWGLCALIQADAATGAIDFDYAKYAQLRLAEYWAWREEDDGSRLREGRDMAPREVKWAA